MSYSGPDGLAGAGSGSATTGSLGMAALPLPQFGSWRRSRMNAMSAEEETAGRTS